ncbi:MAG: hydrogenase iron-sulfur subunit [candidate division WOR-3 bacterium]|nr:hydrogenase iron-sulfur subunit [candidate division WOR-3 bacterium]
MADVGRHPRIRLLTLAEVTEVAGHVGNFRVTVRQKARFVNEKECTACGECAKVCPQLVPDEFNLGLSLRHAIYQPFPQAIPAAYVLNPADCLGLNPIACGKCARACDKKCINLEDQDRELKFEVGAIIVATGMEPFDPFDKGDFGYGRYANVITAMEFERLASSGGPTGGELLRLSDRRKPASIAFIQCVGSRCAEQGTPYCSNICCMNTIKDALVLKEHYPDMEVKVFYIDLRAFAKGFEEMLWRSKRLGVKYIRGIPGEVEEDGQTANLRLYVENTETGKIENHEVEMVVLATGVRPAKTTEAIKQLLSLQLHPEGFLLEAHPKLQPVDSPIRGVFYAGGAEGPKDIKDSVTQASAAAGRAARLLAQGTLAAEPYTVAVDPAKCRACGACLKVCSYQAFEWEKGKPAKPIEAVCAGCGTCAAECRFDAIEAHQFTDEQILAQIEAALAEEPESKSLVFACHWCSFAAADTAGVARGQYPARQVLIRTMCSGRVAEEFVLKAFALGAPVVLVSGCHFADCHYLNANRHTQRRVERLWDRLEAWGIRPERLQLEWISAAQGQRFVYTMQELEKLRQTVTPEEIEKTKEILRNPPRVAPRPEPKEPGEQPFRCLRCGKEFKLHYIPGKPQERTCPYCESNSVRLLVLKEAAVSASAK